MRSNAVSTSKMISSAKRSGDLIKYPLHCTRLPMRGMNSSARYSSFRERSGFGHPLPKVSQKSFGFFMNCTASYHSQRYRGLSYQALLLADMSANFQKAQQNPLAFPLLRSLFRLHESMHMPHQPYIFL